MTKDQDRIWRNRFIALNLARIGGTILVLASLLLWQSDTFVEGGSIIGLPLALVGLVISFVVPQRMVRQWRTPPDP